LNRTLDLQMLASFEGACVLGRYARNSDGIQENTFINEDCATKAQLVCVFNSSETYFQQEDFKIVRKLIIIMLDLNSIKNFFTEKNKYFYLLRDVWSK
jgi:hypothetical protein